MALTIPNTFVNGTPAIATEVNANFTAVKAEVDLKVDSTLVDAKGDLIVATAADTIARQAVGSNGQVLVADSGVTNGVAWVDPQTNRNVVINGAMQITQRGTSTASISSGAAYYTADRWRFVVGSMGTWTESVEADAPTGSGLVNSLKVLCTTADAAPAAADSVFIDQAFEGQNVQMFAKGTASAKPFALSFWVKSNVTGTYIANLADSNTRVVAASYTVSASATWEKKTIIFPADTTGAFGNTGALTMRFWLGAGTDNSSGTLQTTWAARVDANRAVGQTNLAAATDNYWQITGVQLEAGAVATPFEFEDFSTTLDKCQRYFQKSYNLSQYPGTVTGNGEVLWQAAGAGGESAPTVILPTRMRATPTVVFYSSVTGASGNIRNLSTSADVAATTTNSSGERGWSGVGVSLIATTIAGYHFTASAEL